MRITVIANFILCLISLNFPRQITADYSFTPYYNCALHLFHTVKENSVYVKQQNRYSKHKTLIF